MAIELIEDAVKAGAREAPACGLLGISSRTLRRWHSGESLTDQRATAAAERRYPQALSADEREQIIKVCNSEACKSLLPSQIVPRLADEGRYLVSCLTNSFTYLTLQTALPGSLH